jgi:acetyl-CoA carboxylase beta subunit
MEINGKKFIDKYKGYQKKTGQQSALLIGHGKIGGIKAVAVGYNFAFGGAAFSQRENEHFLTAAQFAMQNNVELFLSVYQSGGMSVFGNIHSLKSMSVCQMVHTMLKKKNIINIGILGSKITGGTFVNVFANDFLFSENPVAHDQLFSGKRVSAGVRSSDNTEMPSDFGEGTFLEKHGMIDGCFSSRLEVKTNIVTLTKVLLKKAQTQAKNEASNVTIDKSLQSAS